jgi:hypothetical protein
LPPPSRPSSHSHQLCSSTFPKSVAPCTGILTPSISYTPPLICLILCFSIPPNDYKTTAWFFISRSVGRNINQVWLFRLSTRPTCIDTLGYRKVPSLAHRTPPRLYPWITSTTTCLYQRLTITVRVLSHYPVKSSQNRT